MRDIWLLLHIVFVAVWLGANIVQAVASPAYSKAGSEARIWWASQQGFMARVLYNVAGIGTLITGLLLLLAVDGPYEFSHAFVSIGFVAIIVGAALGMAVFGPGCRKLVAAIESGDRATEDATVKKLATFGVIDTLVVVFTIYAMVAKLGV